MICEMEVISDSSCDSVIISGPIPDYPELKRRKTNSRSPPRNRHRKDNDDQDVINLDEKVEKIQELEDLVNATASLPIGSDHRGDGDNGNWSGSDTKSLKGGRVRSLRDKNSVQAAYIDVLCGMLGEDMKEKFRDRQGLGILGNVKADDEDRIGVDDGNEDGAGWCPDDGEGGARDTGEDSEMQAKEREFYCVEELDNLPSTSCPRLAESGIVEELQGSVMGEKRSEQEGHEFATDTGVFIMNNGNENGDDVNFKENKEISTEKPGGPAEVFIGNVPAAEEDDQVVASKNELPAVYKEEKDTCHEYDADLVTKNATDKFNEIPTAENNCQEYDSVPISENGCQQYDSIAETKNDCRDYAPETGIHYEEFGVPETQNERELPEYRVPDSQSCYFRHTGNGHRQLPVADIPEVIHDHLNIQELLDSGDHFLNFKDTTGTENSLIQVALPVDFKVIEHGLNGCSEAVSSTTQDVEMNNRHYDQHQP